MTSTPLDANDEAGKLPPDVLELIFDGIICDSGTGSRRDTSSLQACCLVSKSWVYLCRSRLFQDIEVGLWRKEIKPDRRKRLADIIKNQPSIGNFIRTIGYTGTQGYDEEAEGRDECLSSFIGLPNVRNLEILSSDSQDYEKGGVQYFGWRLLLNHYISSGQLTGVSIAGADNLPLLRIVSSPALEKLTLFNCSIAGFHRASSLPDVQAAPESRQSFFQGYDVRHLWWPHLAILCRQLKRLSLTAVTDDEDTEGDNNSDLQNIHPLTFPRVASVSISGADLCKYVGETSAAIFPAATGLHVYGPFPEASQLPRFQQLQILKFTVNKTYLNRTISFDTFDWDHLARLAHGSIQTLTHLRLDIALVGSVQNFLMKLSSILADSKYKNALQCIELVVDDCSLAFTLDSLSYTGWKKLADTLSTNQAEFSCLQDVFIIFWTHSSMVNMYSEVGGHILADPMEKLIACPHINFEYTVHVKS